MDYYLNDIDLATYGIIPGHAPGSNIALAGFLDMPARTGKTFHDWGDEDGIEAYVAASDLVYAGRDIVFYGFITGSRPVVKDYLDALYTAVKAFTDVVTLSTPYGDFEVYVKDVRPSIVGNSGASVIITFREPVVTLSSGTIPATAASLNTIDGVPFSSFGLYLFKADALYDLPELKEQLFTKYGSEGYQLSKRKHNTLDIKGFLIADSISDLQDKVEALYKSLSATGTRTVIINNEVQIVCFATEGFKVSNIILASTKIVAEFSINMIVVSQSIPTLGVPVATSATNVYDTSFLANWNFATMATGYYLDVSTADDFSSFVTGYENKDIGNNLSSSVNGLTAGTTYYYRVRGYNTYGTGSNSNTITTPTIPDATTADAATSISYSSFYANWDAVSGATKYYLDVSIASNFSSFVTGFENKDVSDVQTYQVTGLTMGKNYYYRVRAANGSGSSANSNGVTLKTTIEDADGNVYTSVIIGTQEWLIENLKTAKYNDGSLISIKTSKSDWANATSGAYCWRNFSALNKSEGAFYNFYAIDNAKGIAPGNFRISTTSDWTTLQTYLSGETVAGGKLKRTGTTTWNSPNSGADNSSGFTADAFGIIALTGDFYEYLERARYWSSTHVDSTTMDFSILFYDSAYMSIYSSDDAGWDPTWQPCVGLKVRCVRDV